MRKAIVQEDSMGCGIACTAFVLEKNYKTTKKYFRNLGDPNKTGFTCKSIVKVLSKQTLGKFDQKRNYKTKYLKNKIKFKDNSIVFIKRSKSYQHGHYLVYYKRKWMDPWINLKETKNIKEAKAGFRKRLPGKPVYVIFLSR